MRYYFTDFFRWEQPLITQLREDGYFVYHLRSHDEGPGFNIEHRVYVNNIGFLITDTELDLPEFGIDDKEFYALGGEEDIALGDVKLATAEKIFDQLAQSKAEYEKRQKEQERSWAKFDRWQRNANERARHYKLYHRNENPPTLPDGTALVVQHIYGKKRWNTQEVMYFLLDSDGKMMTDSLTIDVKYNCRFSTIIKEIAKRHGFTV